MATITTVVEELNRLCHQYLQEGQGFQDTEKLAGVLRDVRSLGYTIVTPHLISDIPEYNLFPEEENRDFQRMVEVRQKKLQAIENGNFEIAADLREEERRLLARVQHMIPAHMREQFFVVAGKDAEIVLFNHPDNILMPLFIKVKMRMINEKR